MKKKPSDKELIKLLPAFPCGKLREFLKSPKDVRRFAEKIAEAKAMQKKPIEKRCTWTVDRICIVPDCRHFVITNYKFILDFKFCPYCGGKIKWWEGK